MMIKTPEQAWNIFREYYTQWECDTAYHPLALGLTAQRDREIKKVLSGFWSMCGSNELVDLICDEFSGTSRSRLIANIKRILLKKHSQIFIKSLSKDLDPFIRLAEDLYAEGDNDGFEICAKKVKGLTPPPPDYLEDFYLACDYLCGFFEDVYDAIDDLRSASKI